ncbi:MAG TPA: ribonuclease III domain-containing protein [Clostridia bacterium]|nr:ribonuclease III domain-containing protein [Clostridia bacterium]
MATALAPVNRYNSLQLAYLGDAVYELYIREYLLASGFMSPGELNRRAKAYVSARAQSKAYFEVEKEVTSQEENYLRRGRNAKGGAAPSSASISDYRRATGLESLLGALYVMEKKERITEIMDICIRVLEENNEKLV